MATITFAGAAGEVTGSRHMLGLPGGKILLDCGLFQGHRHDAEAKNRRFIFNPREISAVILSHAHLDHTGNLPTLVKRGFKGTIYCTRATAELVAVLLADSAAIQRKDAEFFNKKHPSARIDPLYTQADIAPVTALLRAVDYGERFSPVPNSSARLTEAGHILGSAQTELDWQENGAQRRLIFTGDLGRRGMPLLRDPEQPHAADTVIIEATYGNRVHAPTGNAEANLKNIIRRTVNRGGKVFIPAFALGRAQEIASLLENLHAEGALGRVPVYVDSPLAAKTTEVFSKNRALLDDEFHRDFKNGGPFNDGWVRYISSQADSIKLNGMTGPAIIIAPSGMCEGGRILHHLRNNLPDPRNTVVLAGYQAEGTLGRKLSQGANEVPVFGLPVKVNAEVITAHDYSAHADSSELLDYIKNFSLPPERVFLVHGEPDAARALCAKMNAAHCAGKVTPAAYAETEII